MRYEHLAHDAQPACLPQQREAERIDVNDERDLPKSCRRLTSRAARESLVRVRVEQERIARRQRANPRCSNSSIGHLSPAVLAQGTARSRHSWPVMMARPAANGTAAADAAALANVIHEDIRTSEEGFALRENDAIGVLG
ncbi:MAG TPA: hypothetical protein VI485_16255 [Vicinamibacterales bacterium]|nr:hypothetical protein [Vicinamibacterales bacterium]